MLRKDHTRRPKIAREILGDICLAVSSSPDTISTLAVAALLLHSLWLGSARHHATGILDGRIELPLLRGQSRHILRCHAILD